jgi:hypothetical protein
MCLLLASTLFISAFHLFKRRPGLSCRNLTRLQRPYRALKLKKHVVNSNSTTASRGIFSLKALLTVVGPALHYGGCPLNCASVRRLLGISLVAWLSAIQPQRQIVAVDIWFDEWLFVCFTYRILWKSALPLGRPIQRSRKAEVPCRRLGYYNADYFSRRTADNVRRGAPYKWPPSHVMLIVLVHVSGFEIDLRRRS